MRIHHENRGPYLLIGLIGRLDATWCEYFEEQLFTLVRQGNHRLIMDASELEYMSSAGIRSLARLYKELLGVQGSFVLTKPTQFVQKTLEATGFSQWLSDAWPEDMPGPPAMQGTSNAREDFQVFQLSEEEAAGASHPGSKGLVLNKLYEWEPWGVVKAYKPEQIDLGSGCIALGIGSPHDPSSGISAAYGEFLAVAGNLAYQPPDAGSRPDFMVSEGNFSPVIQAIQAIWLEGSMTHLIRFSPENQACFGLSELAKKALETTGANMVGFVALGEIDGMVGAHLIMPPEAGGLPDFPELRDSLMFSGERMHAGKQALVVGLVSRSETNNHGIRLFAMGGAEQPVFGHLHAVVFPYQPVQNGLIDLKDQTNKFFHASPPLMVLHLLADSRPITGLGESALIRGACWCAPVNVQEGLL